MSRFRPLLGAPVTLEQLKTLHYPVLVSPKYDGIRALVLGNGQLVTRKLKPVKNKWLRALFGVRALRYHDGELVLGVPTAPDCYHRTQSVVNSAEDDPSGIKYYVFDTFEMPASPYCDRMQFASHNGVVRVPQFRANDWQRVLELEEQYAAKGWEGIMLRAYTGYYKFGRSTVGEELLLKLKRTERREARVLSVYPRAKNTNPQERDERGYAKRSSAKAGKVATKLLGGFHCRDLKSGVEFDCGTGVLKKNELDLEQWEREVERGLIITYSCQPAGQKERPRYPRFYAKFHGRRTRSDM